MRLNYLLVIVLLFSLGCSKPVQQVAELPSMNIGIVGMIQPMGTTDLLAGYIPTNRGLASHQELLELNARIQDILKQKTKRQYTFFWDENGTNPSESRTASRNNALAHWVKVGKDMGVELLIVPQVLNWHERQGGAAGVVKSAEINVDFFLIDVREDGSLVSRSHYQEKQQSLSDNLLTLDTFLKRGGRWLTAQELAAEATQKMIQEFGL